MGQMNDNEKRRSTMPKAQRKPRKNQVSLAGVAQTPVKKEKKPFPVLKLVIALLLIIGMLVAGILLFRFWSGTQVEKPSVSARDRIEYFYTPDELAADVSYYLFGITGHQYQVDGEDVLEPLDMLAVMCYDRQAQSVSVMQIPVDTYIDKENGFAVDTIGDVWYHPQPDIFCSSCRERVPEEDRDEKNRHAACGADLEQKKGSAKNDLIRVINEQYGLPIDNYFFLPREGLVSLINSLKGVQVELATKTTLVDEVYDSGLRTLDGAAAVEYAFTYNYKVGNPDSDRDRMQRQRQVMASLWERLAACEMKDLYFVDDLGLSKGVVSKLMLGANPILSNETSFGRARMLGISDKEAENMDMYDALARFCLQLGDVPAEQVSFSILPGETELKGTTKVYSVNCEQLSAFLNEQMMPYALPEENTGVTAPQLSEVMKEADLATVTLDTILPMVEDVPEEDMTDEVEE